MNVRRLRPADWLTGVSGLALLLLLWAPWYGVSDGTINAWSAFAVIDLWLALTALLAIAVPVVTANRDSPALPVAFDVITAAVSVIAVLLVIIRLLAIPGGEVADSREWGLYLGALATLGTCVGSWWAMRDESAPGLREPPQARTVAAPPPGAGPEPTTSPT
jgi:hypothetical protein